MKKWKIKRFFKSIWRYVSFAFQLPHFITMIVLLSASIICLLISLNAVNENETVSSILSNVFAGLITGIAICLISGLRGVTSYRIKGKIEWLENLHNECIDFIKMHRGLLLLDLSNSDKVYEKTYDLICKASGINTTISQSQFNKKLCFNAITFCKKKLNYDCEQTKNLYAEVRDKIIDLDVNTITKKELLKTFSEVNTIISKLNGVIVNKLDELKTQQNMVNRFFI